MTCSVKQRHDGVAKSWDNFLLRAVLREALNKKIIPQMNNPGMISSDFPGSDFTVIVDARGNAEAGLRNFGKLGDRLILLLDDTAPVPPLPPDPPSVEILRPGAAAALKSVFQSVTTASVGYVPGGIMPGDRPSTLPPHPHLLPWLPALQFPTETACESAIAISAWIASTSLIQKMNYHLHNDSDYTLLNITTLLQSSAIEMIWGTASAMNSSTAVESPPPLSCSFPCSSLRVLAIVPHLGCEPWLGQCLRSLLNQTRPPDHIVVVDDGSAVPPLEIVQSFPTVTLLATAEQSGPYRLIQQVIEDTQFDAYLFQDADDWSSGDRLQKLLAAMEQTGCELVGTQEVRVVETELRPVCYPLDVNRALAEKPGHGLLHPTSLVRRDLVMRLGGFATGLRFGGDTEFLLRAVRVARVINLPDFAYFRRKRPDSLTTAAHTGLNSPARQALIQQCKARAIANQAAIQAGRLPDLTPLAQAGPLPLRHLAGPHLSQTWG